MRSRKRCGKTTAMPMRYGEEVQAGLGEMARSAKALGRAETFTLPYIWCMMQLRKKPIDSAIQP
jgi:hypothetical protein